MRIADKQIATLRAQLAGQKEKHERLLDQLVTEEEKLTYGVLVTAALFEAIERKFVKDGRAVDDSVVINFIAHQRAIHPNSADQLDPTVAENVVLNALGKAPLGDFDGETVFITQILLLAALVGDADFTAKELDEFLSKARSEADKYLT